MSRAAEYLREIRPTITLAVPMIIGHVSQMLMGVIDSAMIGHAGTVPLAAASFAILIFNLFYVLGIGAMIPVSIYVSRARGADKPEEAAEYLRHGLALAVLIGAGEMVLMFALSTQLERFGQPAEVLAIVRPFFLLFASSIMPVLIYLALRQFSEAMGHPWAPMFILLGSVAVNAVLNWILIYGNLGMPALGLTGAGISTLVARTLDAVVTFWWLRRSRAVRAAWPSFARGVDGSAARTWWRGYSVQRFRQMLQVGLPAAGMLLFEASAFAFSGIMIGWLGSVPLAAHQVALSCASLTFMFPLGLSIAAGMRVSRAVGAGERGRLRPIAFGTIGLGLSFMLTFAFVFAFAGGVIATWFVDDRAVIVLATQLLVVAAFFQLFDGVQVIGASVLRGITDVRVPAVITFVAYWLIALPVGYAIGVRGPYGAVGVWTGIASGLAFAAVFLTVRFARLTRRG